MKGTGDSSLTGKQTPSVPPCPAGLQVTCWECISEVQPGSAAGTSGCFCAQDIYKFGVQRCLHKCQRYF